MMPPMRTTVTLEPDVARMLADQVRRTRKSFKETLNTAVRSGLRRAAQSPGIPEFILEARPMQLKAGVDAGRFNALLDDLDTEVWTATTRSNKRKSSGR